MFKILPIFNVSIECQLFMLMKFFDLWAAGGKLDLQPEGLKTYRCHSMNFLIATWNRVLIFTHQKIEQDWSCQLLHWAGILHKRFLDLFTIKLHDFRSLWFPSQWYILQLLLFSSRYFDPIFNNYLQVKFKYTILTLPNLSPATIWVHGDVQVIVHLYSYSRRVGIFRNHHLYRLSGPGKSLLTI